MSKGKPGIPKGTRDFDPAEVAGRDLIFNTIRGVYQLHGFKPIETPAMENLSTLMGKYGEEGDRLIFRILNSGDFPSKVADDLWQSKDALKLSARLSEKALRYDLTVPFARFVVQHQHKITFPFKRYQIQPVWRADRPQKGRYREFYQCDADVIGSDAMANEAEFIQIIDEVFEKLNIRVCIHLNNRKILVGLAEYIGYPDQIIDITTAIDKLDKIGLEGVIDELINKGLSPEAIDKLKPVLLLEGTNPEKLNTLKEILVDYSIGLKGVEEMEELFAIAGQTAVQCDMELDLCLARGLNYYTGTIIEVKARDVAIGSICGGGRYDDLTGIFGLKGMSGIGISFGAERIYDVMQNLDLFPEGIDSYTQLLALNFGDKERDHCLPMLAGLRAKGVRCEMYPETAKIKKQMQYADKNKIPYVLIAGEEEIRQERYALKNMHTGDQKMCSREEIETIFTSNPSNI